MVESFKKMLCFLLCDLILISTAPVQLFSQTEKSTKTLAILDLEGQAGVTEQEASTLTQWLQARIINTNVFTVLERGKMQDILNEQGFQVSGCTGGECVVEIGQMLGVEQMIAGSIGKIGDIHTLNVRLFSVQSGEIIRTVSRTYQGSKEGLLGTVEEIAYEICFGEPITTKRTKFLKWAAALVVIGGVTVAAIILTQPEPAGGIGNPPDFPNVP